MPKISLCLCASLIADGDWIWLSFPSVNTDGFHSWHLLMPLNVSRWMAGLGIIYSVSQKTPGQREKLSQDPTDTGTVTHISWQYSCVLSSRPIMMQCSSTANEEQADWSQNTSEMLRKWRHQASLRTGVWSKYKHQFIKGIFRPPDPFYDLLSQITAPLWTQGNMGGLRSGQTYLGKLWA